MSDYISRQAVLNTLDNMDKALDEERTVEMYKELLTECIKVLPSAEGEYIKKEDAIAELEKHQLSRDYCIAHNIDSAIDMCMTRLIIDGLPTYSFPERDDTITEDMFMILTGDITDCTIEEFIAKVRDRLQKIRGKADE